MKNFKLFKSGFGEKLKLLLIPIGLLIGSFTMPAWGTDWYSHNNASTIWFNDYTTNWVSDPSSNGIAFLMGRDNDYGGQSIGSRSYRMTHIAHTKLWYCDVPKWGNDKSNESMYQFIAFRFVSGTTGWNDWQSGWDNRVTGRAQYGSNTKYAMTYNHNITGRNQFYTPSSSSSNTAMTACNNCFDSEKKFTAYLRVNFDEEGDGTYDGVISGETTWSHSVTFDFTGTYMKSGNKTSTQSTIYSLNKNCWTDGDKKWGYGGIPITGEVTFLLKTIDTGFEIAGWAYSESATSPTDKEFDENPTFQVLSETSYVAFIRRKSYTITLNDNGGSGGSGSVTTTYDRSYNMTSNVTVPTKTGYTFQGYYTNSDGTGTQIIDANGAWKKDITGYTGTDDSSNPKWIRDEEVTLHAKWEQTITLDKNGSDGSNTTATAVYNAAGPFAPAATQTYTDHTLLHYKTSDGTPILTTSGAFYSSSISNYVTDGKWTKANATTLYAHWKVNAPSSITCTDNVVTISVPTDATVHYTLDGSAPTSSSPTYNPSSKPVIASSGITVKAIAVQSGCTTSDITSQAVTYTPVYDVTLNTTNANNTGGSSTVLENHTYTATYTTVTGYNLPNDVEVVIDGDTKTKGTDYTWSAGTLTILENKIEGNVEIIVNGVAKTYESGTLDKVDGDDNGEYSVTYNDTKIVIEEGDEPVWAGYEVLAYYLDYDADELVDKYTTLIAYANKNLKANVSTYTDVNGKWIYDGAPTLYTKWTPKTYTITLDRQGGTEGPTSFTVTMGDNNYSPETVKPTRAGYHFEGYYTEESGEGTQIFNENGEAKANVSGYTSTYSKWDNTTEDLKLYAYWTEVELTFDNDEGSGDGDWNTASNWNPACVPTSGHDVTISAEATVNGSAVAKSVTIDQSTGSLTIASTGTLDVIGTISNAADERLEVMAGGSLIFDYTNAPAAKVHHSVSGGDFRYIALPISYVHVSNAFAGQGVYTYVWHEGSGWERRGYYDDILGNEPIAIFGQSSWTFYGTLVNALFGSVAYTSGKTYAGMNMYANSWTAPIRISGVTISGTGAIQTVYTDNGGSWSPTTVGDPGDAVIPAMSAFVILSNEGGGSVSIPYNTAVRNVAVSPASAPKRVASDDLRKHITMNVIGNELKTNLRLYENEQFTNEFDNGWEAPFLEGDGRAGQLYSQTDDKMVILAKPDLEGTVVGFIPGEATDYTISFEGDGKGYYLNDLDEQESTLIEEGNTYVFTPNESTNATRFVISKTPIHKTTTGNDAIYDGSKARKQMIDGILYIIRDGRMYDATGALVK